MRKLLHILLLLPFLSSAQEGSTLQAGPMLGYTEMREAAIWLQTRKSATVYLTYWEVDNPKLRQTTKSITTREEDLNTAKFICTMLEPGTDYQYEVYVEGTKETFDYPLIFKTQKLWQYRTDPPDMKIAMGSCFYVNEERYDRPGAAYGGGYEILEAIRKKSPDLMLWLGDNTYYREPDFGGYYSMGARQTHTRSLPELQPLLAATSHIAIWDDHDFGPNDSYGTFAHKRSALRLFRLFWANPQEAGNVPGNIAYHRFGDVAFYLLDNRWYRSPVNSAAKPEMLGKDQMQWLIESLIASNASFNFVVVGGQVLNSAKVYETYANYEKEREELLQKLAEKGIKNVIFLTGDRHHSEVSKMETSSGLIIHDFTISPLTSRPNTRVNEENMWRVSGSLVQERNFAVMEISGKRKERRVQLVVYDAGGKELYRYAHQRQP
jgi:alkaline phosphatase D